MVLDDRLEFKKLDSSTVILGFTGPIGSGCSYISEMIPKISDKRKYKYYKLSDIIRKALREDGNKKPSIQEQQDKGNELRGKNGDGGYLVGELLKQIDIEWEPDIDYGIIIDGIKNEGEVLTLQNFPNFYLFSIQADKELRQARVLKAKLFKDEDEFNQADERDEREEFRYGQQVKRCNYLADVVIMNDADFPKAATLRKKQLVSNVYEKYVHLIETSVDGERATELSPSIDELCMTIAYALSKSSSCLKRKVGALIVDIGEMQDKTDHDQGKQQSIPVVVSSGYNEVPVGSYKCVFHPDYQMCYRDYLQEEYAARLTHCPSCGKKINLNYSCPNCGEKINKFVKNCKSCGNEVEIRYQCPGCKLQVFDHFIPGGKRSPGKLLDMCRALHAEEIALLKLAMSGDANRNNLVLYVTTQPCNLCSNKIVSSKVRKVVFDEPYSMKESREILTNSKVELRRFQGIKSSAYFRLYH
jgi:deoxycytidylate deaminase